MKDYRIVKLGKSLVQLPAWLKTYEGRVLKVSYRDGSWYLRIQKSEKEIIAPST
jgi:hypothetical protein